MAKYSIEVQLTAAEDAAMQEVATKAGKSLQQTLKELVDDRVMSQVHQWISDEVKAELAKLPAADALGKLRAQA